MRKSRLGLLTGINKLPEISYFGAERLNEPTLLADLNLGQHGGTLKRLDGSKFGFSLIISIFAKAEYANVSGFTIAWSFVDTLMGGSIIIIFAQNCSRLYL